MPDGDDGDLKVETPDYIYKIVGRGEDDGDNKVWEPQRWWKDGSSRYCPLAAHEGAVPLDVAKAVCAKDVIEKAAQEAKWEAAQKTEASEPASEESETSDTTSGAADESETSEPVPAEQAEPAKTTGSKKSSAEPAPVEPTESEMVVLTTGRLAGIAVIAPDPQEFIDQYGAEIAERYARSMLAKLGVDAPDASSTRSEAPKNKALKPGVPLPWDDCAPMKEDGGYRRGSADTSIKSGYRISPAWKDDKPYGHEVERLKFGSKVAAVTVKSGDFTYDEAKAIAQADFDAGGK
jgi:hypothetical protein